MILIFPIVLLVRGAFTPGAGRLQGRLLLLAWLAFSVGPAVHYALFFMPLPALPGWLDALPRLGARLVAESYLIGTLLIFACTWIALRRERRPAAITTRLAA